MGGPDSMKKKGVVTKRAPLALSRDKKGVRKLAEKGQVITRPADVL